jgi:magnesium-transporting ATPase (P-type)
MYARTIAIALLVLVAVVMAQNTPIIDVDKVKEGGEETLKNAKIVVLAINYVALAAMIGASVYILFVRKRSFPELFGEWWFWVPIALQIVPVILYLLSDFTPLVKSVYDWIKQDQCPFLYCP